MQQGVVLRGVKQQGDVLQVAVLCCANPPAPGRPHLQTADLSAKNLGNEGFAYVVDSLSFNER